MVWIKINEDDKELTWVESPPRQTKREKKEETKRFVKAAIKGINWDRVFKKKY